jgi:hypothetical protein
MTHKIAQLQQQITQVNAQMTQFKAGFHDLSENIITVQRNLQRQEREALETWIDKMIHLGRIEPDEREFKILTLLALPLEAREAEIEQIGSRRTDTEGFDLASKVRDRNIRDYAEQHGLNYAESMNKLGYQY